MHNKAGRIGAIEKTKSSAVAVPQSTPDVAPMAKRDAVLAAGAEVFMEQGFAAASMDEVARRAAVSKATIYSYFGNKHALFGAIVTGKCQGMLPTITQLGDRPPAEALTLIGRQFIDLILSAGALPLYRVVLADAARFPDLGRAFYDAGANRCAAALADYFAQQNALGALDIADPRLAAEQFFGMVLGHTHVRILLGVADQVPPPAERDRIVGNAVRIFLQGAAKHPA